MRSYKTEVDSPACGTRDHITGIAMQLMRKIREEDLAPCMPVSAPAGIISPTLRNPRKETETCKQIFGLL